MSYVFLVCAVVGGTVFIVQFVMSLVGMGADDLDFADDMPDDLPDDVGDVQGNVLDHGSTWLFGVISFRTVVAALTFFGLAGMASLQSDVQPAVSLLVALASGVAAMYGVHWMMQTLYKLRHDGTFRVERAVGKRGSVYVPIPGDNSGAGKIQLRLKNRIMEYQAMTAGPDKLPTGTRIEVVSIISPSTVQVEPLHETAAAENA